MKLIPVDLKDLNSYDSSSSEFIKRLAISPNELNITNTNETFPKSIPPEAIIIWLVSQHSKSDIIDKAKDIEPALRYRTILIGYEGEDRLGLLESTQLGGLISGKSIRAWLANTPPKFLKLGEGQGIIGLKSAFDEKLFDSSFTEIQNSENYMIFYNYTIHDLDKILRAMSARCSLVVISPIKWVA